MGLDIDSIVNPFLAVNATRLATATGVLTRGRPTLLSSFTSPAVLLALSVAYLALCSALRFRHEKAMRRRFNYPDRASFSRMTSDDAQAIIADLMSYEFPLLYKTSLQFAIFKVSGEPAQSSDSGDFSPRMSPGLPLTCMPLPTTSRPTVLNRFPVFSLPPGAFPILALRPRGMPPATPVITYRPRTPLGDFFAAAYRLRLPADKRSLPAGTKIPL